MKRLRSMFLLAFAIVTGCTGEPTANDSLFLNGTFDDPEIGLVINSTGKSLTMFQLGRPDQQRQIPFGASNAVTPTGLAHRGIYAVVPLGNAASVALVNLAAERIERFFTMPSGNATGTAWVDNNTFLAANLLDDYVGRATLDQASNEITAIVTVAPAPTAIVVAGARAFVISGNLDANFISLGNGIVTAIDPATMAIIDDVETGGTNPTAAAIGPDGKLYVLNTGDYVSGATLTIIDPQTLAVETTVTGFLAGSGAIRIDHDGLAYVSSSFAFVGKVGTVVWNTATRTFVRDADHPVCAGDPCRGAFDAHRAADGSLYQAFFGSPSESLPPYIFVYAPGTYELVDSIAAGVGPATIEVARFR